MINNESNLSSSRITKQVDMEQEEINLMIREAEPIDARAILGLLRHVGRDTNYLTFGPEGSPYDVNQERQLIRKFQESPTSIFLIIEVDDQIVGVANLITLDQVKEQHVAEVGICIIQEYWGYGIGKILVEELIYFARQVDLKVLTLEVVTENTRAIRLYEKFGFKQCGRLSMRIKNKLKYYDTFVMELIL